MSDDYCYECDTVTAWSNEQCTGCGRTWGYPLDEQPQTNRATNWRG
jgi:hypothetical protein